MPPIYDFRCECTNLESPVMGFNEYDEFTELECSSCGNTLTKKHREIDDNIQKNVLGSTRKGHYGSTDMG